MLKSLLHASEVLHSYDIIEDDLYDSQKIIFSFGKFLYQILYGQHPIDNVEHLNIKAAIGGMPPKFKDVSVAEISYDPCHEALFG